MGEKALVESQITDSIELIKKLDSEGVQPTFALWYYHDDPGEWSLLLGGPFLDALLAKDELTAYRKVVDVMAAAELSSLTVSDVKLVPSRSALPTAIRTLTETPSDGFRRSHFSDTTLNGIFIKEMIIIRSA